MPRIVNAVVSYFRYAQKIFWPVGLGVFYPHPGAWLLGLVIISACFLLGGSIVVWFERNRRPYVFVGWLWFIGTLVPVIGLVQVGDQAMADRYMYVPSIGLFVLAAWAMLPELRFGKSKEIPKAREFESGRFTLAEAGVIFLWLAALAGCLTVSFRQIGFWKNSLTLFSHTAEVVPGNWLALNNTGFYLSSVGRLDEAKSRLMESLQIKPDNGPAWNNLGTIMEKQGQMDEAVVCYRRALQFRPTDAQPHNNLGNLLITRGDLPQAESEIITALKLDPRLPQANYNLANILVLRSNLPGAIDKYRQAINLQPSYLEAHYNLGVCLVKIGQTNQATAHFEEVLRLQPGFQNARAQLERLRPGGSTR
jgi:Flp pilus assembly protein TadD